MENDAPLDRLAALIRIPTVSLASRPSRPDQEDGGADPASPAPGAEDFDALLATMAEQWPRLHELDVTRVGHHGLLIHWPGHSASHPVVMMAHLDVVPVVPEEWTHPPFAGEVIDGELWGRGTLDDKGCVAGLCEAVETLLRDGHVPTYDVWLSFGCDEETTGEAARAAVAELRRRGVRPWMVVDEGGAIASEAFPGLGAPIGVVGVTEKGTTAVRLTVTDPGGHASTPAKGGPAARLAKALLAVDGATMPGHVSPVTVDLFRRLAPSLPIGLRQVAAQVGRMGPVAAVVLSKAGPEAAAMVRTTVAITTLRGSKAINVLPSTVQAGLNLRVMVGDTVAGVVERLRKAINDDAVVIEVVDANEPSPVSPWQDDPAFGHLENTIRAVYPDAIAAPYVMLAATDSRFFTPICDRVYRFAPFRMTRAQRASIHGADERIGVDDYLAGVGWYRRFLQTLPEQRGLGATR
ncbi:M20/M25/M40 family metallo-hydrolase [Nocardioides sp.]|uniref:M20/M25/M40 family metallo-hydrolase n=1 Tax=Nocardioides sp. TaxID=35761 RepID=UPI00262F147A|nr:M20/M25/M40 family metallo-hydrolase [Nocardioides sp.]